MLPTRTTAAFKHSCEKALYTRSTLGNGAYICSCEVVGVPSIEIDYKSALSCNTNGTVFIAYTPFILTSQLLDLSQTLRFQRPFA